MWIVVYLMVSIRLISFPIESYYTMKEMTFAQHTILNEIETKRNSILFQNGLSNETVAYNESHGDYSEYC